MKKKLLAWSFLFVIAASMTGCSSIQNYSIKSYQGPLPLEDYRYVNLSNYGVPASAAKP